MKERAGMLKEEVREIVKGTKELPKILDLIVTLQRLGLDNHYEVEIEYTCALFTILVMTLKISIWFHCDFIFSGRMAMMCHLVWPYCWYKK